MARLCDITLSREESILLNVSASHKRLSCASWIREYARVHADQEPDADNEWQLDNTHKSEILVEYKADCDKSFVESVSRSTFYEVWTEQCSNIKIREFKNVTGKCQVCAMFSEMRRKSNSLNARAELTATYSFHRATFAKERSLYHDRIIEAISEPRRVWSINGDGMQQVSIGRTLTFPLMNSFELIYVYLFNYCRATIKYLGGPISSNSRNPLSVTYRVSLCTASFSSFIEHSLALGPEQI